MHLPSIALIVIDRMKKVYMQLVIRLCKNSLLNIHLLHAPGEQMNNTASSAPKMQLANISSKHLPEQNMTKITIVKSVKVFE